ncbi:MAG: hypothetical protein O7G85_10045, partial [Planctomycetota bacterium]|nr:hypothetical protein [Planctomycetota bacterium]
AEALQEAYVEGLRELRRKAFAAGSVSKRRNLFPLSAMTTDEERRYVETLVSIHRHSHQTIRRLAATLSPNQRDALYMALTSPSDPGVATNLLGPHIPHRMAESLGITSQFFFYPFNRKEMR